VWGLSAAYAHRGYRGQCSPPDIDLETGVLRIRQARVDVNGEDTIVATKTDRSARNLPLPPRGPRCSRRCARCTCVSVWPWGGPWPTMICCYREPTGHGLPVRDYSRGFTAMQKAAGLKAITLGKLRHSNNLADTRDGQRRRRRSGLAWPHGAHDAGGLRAGHRRPFDRRIGGVLGGGRTKLGHLARTRSAANERNLLQTRYSEVCLLWS
jgi:hypothetical protein